jgi:hypothetical protein
MKINFATFSDEKFKDRQKELTKQAEGLFDVVHEYGIEWLTETEFYKKNQHILDQKRGAGFCLWKPFLVFETLKTMEDGDVLFYLDSADTFKNEIKDFLKAYFSNENNEIILTAGAFPNKDWTKRDCFILMECDEPRFHNAIQLEAGVLAIKKTDGMVNFVEEWLGYCKNENIITTIENVHGENFPSYKDHRYDQSVLTNLALRHGINGTKVLRQFIKCNVYG